MTDDRDLRARFRRAYGDEPAFLAVSARLRDHLATIPRARRQRTALPAVAAVAAVLLVGGSASAAIISNAHHAAVGGGHSPRSNGNAAPVPRPSAVPTPTPAPACAAAAVTLSTVADVTPQYVSIRDVVTNHSAVKCVAPEPVSQQIVDQHGTQVERGTLPDSTSTLVDAGATVDVQTFDWSQACPSACGRTRAVTETVRTWWSDGRSTSATFTIPNASA